MAKTATIIRKGNNCEVWCEDTATNFKGCTGEQKFDTLTDLLEYVRTSQETLKAKGYQVKLVNETNYATATA